MASSVTKRGRPVATIQPVKKKPWKSLKGSWAGKIEIVGGIVACEAADLWNAVRDPER